MTGPRSSKSISLPLLTEWLARTFIFTNIKGKTSYCYCYSFMYISIVAIVWLIVYWLVTILMKWLIFLATCTYYCVTRAPILYFIRSWVALSFKVVSEWVSQSGIGNTCPDLHFLQYIKAWMSSTDPVSPIRNCYRLIVSYTGPEHSFIIS